MWPSVVFYGRSASSHAPNDVGTWLNFVKKRLALVPFSFFLELDFTYISLSRKQGSKDTTVRTRKNRNRRHTRDPPARSRGQALVPFSLTYFLL